MILFGTRGINRTVGSGDFYCPRCATERTYTHKAVKRFFTLYFIPLIPMGTAGEFAECTSCAGTFGMEILNYDPAAERQKTIDQFRRMSVAFLLDVNRCKAGELEALQDVIGDIAGEDVEADTVAQDVRQAQQANVEAMGFIRGQSADLSDEGKWMLMGALRRILERVNPLMPNERERFEALGKALGMRKKHVTEFLDSPMEE